MVHSEGDARFESVSAESLASGWSETQLPASEPCDSKVKDAGYRLRIFRSEQLSLVFFARILVDPPLEASLRPEERKQESSCSARFPNAPSSAPCPLVVTASSGISDAFVQGSPNPSVQSVKNFDRELHRLTHLSRYVQDPGRVVIILLDWQ